LRPTLLRDVFAAAFAMRADFSLELPSSRSFS
jgi:hypothetical protein